MKKFVLKNSNSSLKMGKTTQIFLCKKRHNIDTAKTSAEQLKLDLTNTKKINNEINNEIENLNYTEQEQLEDAEQSVSKQKGKKKKIWNAIFFIINIVVVCGILYYQITHENISSFSELKGLSFYFLPILLIIFAVVMILDAYRTNLFLKKSGNRSRPYLCYKMCAVGRYYDNITPMSSGGEPSQIFYMSHRGLDASSSISVPMARYVVSQMSWMIIGLIAVICIIFTNVMDLSVVLIIGLLGFTINVTLLSICLILSMSKRLGNKLVVKVLRVLQKMHIVKNYEKQYDKVMKVVVSYQNTMTTYAKNKWFFIYTLFISILIYILIYTMPYVIYLMLGGTDYSVWANMLVFGVIIELGSSIIPIPGGSGMNEISFTVVYATVFPEGTVFWGLLFWRFMTYYIFILQGISIIIYDYFVGNRKFKWLQKKWELETESALFKEEQIKKYNKQRKKKKMLKKP